MFLAQVLWEGKNPLKTRISFVPRELIFDLLQRESLLFGLCQAAQQILKILLAWMKLLFGPDQIGTMDPDHKIDLKIIVTELI